MLYRFEIQVEVPEAGKAPLHKDTIEQRVGAVARKAIKDIHKSSARLLLSDVEILDED